MQKTITFQELLDSRKLRKNENGEYPKDKPITHTSLGNTPAHNASFSIPDEDMKMFFDLYAKDVKIGRTYGLIERHKKVCPVIVDLDFKFPEGGDTPKNEKGAAIRQFTHSHIKAIVGLYIAEIEATFAITDKESLCAFVFERPAPYKDKSKNFYKDGIHIMFPHIVSEPWAQFYIRDRILAKLKEKNVFADIKHNNPMSDVIDRTVIETNGWYMFRCSKPNIPAYDLKYIFDRNLDVIDIKDANFGGIENLAYFFSIRRFTEKDCLAIRQECVKEIEKISKNSEDKEIAKFMSSMRKMQKTYYDIGQIAKLLECLTVQRADYEPTWMEVGWCLHNIDKNNIELLNLWMKFSARSEKFKPGECEKRWKSMRKEVAGKRLGIGSLYYWAKNDNYEKYMEIKRADICKSIDESLSNTNYDVSKVLYEMYKDQYKFASTRPSTWYEFREHRWYQIEDGIALRKKISTELLQEYGQMISNYSIESTNINSDPSIEENLKAKQVSLIEKKTNQLIEVMKSLKSTTYKEKIMKEARDLFYDEDFLKKMDENPKLICFNNGVLDLTDYTFRPGAPDDYISMCMNIDYVPLDETTEEFTELDSFIKQVFRNDDVRHYTLKWMGSLLEGFNKDEKLHVLSGAVGSNGKSKTNELLCEVLGDYAGKFNTTLLTGKRAASNAPTPDLSSTKGKRYMYMEEPSEGEKMNIGLMKEFSGGDKIKCRGLYQAPIEFKPQFKMALICNDKPKVPPTDGGSWRRLVVIEFTSRFVDEPKEDNEFKRDYSISDKLKNWKEAFAALLVKYHRIYAAEGLRAPREIAKYTDEYQSENDIYADYFKQTFEKTDNMNVGNSVDEVYDEFKDWITTNNPGTRHPSKKEMQEYVCRRYSKKYIAGNRIVGFERRQNSQVSTEQRRLIDA